MPVLYLAPPPDAPDVASAVRLPPPPPPIATIIPSEGLETELAKPVPPAEALAVEPAPPLPTMLVIVCGWSSVIVVVLVMKSPPPPPPPPVEAELPCLDAPPPPPPPTIRYETLLIVLVTVKFVLPDALLLVKVCTQ
jgi:hypothetical protein